MTDEAAQIKAALRQPRLDDEPPSDWGFQVLARVPAPLAAQPSWHEQALWLALWALLLLLALVMISRLVDAKVLASACLAVLPWMPLLVLMAVFQVPFPVRSSFRRK